MGDAADDAFDLYLRNQESKQRKPRNYQQGVGNFKWKDSEGNILDMWEMSDEHIENAINTCIRWGNTAKKIQLEHVLNVRKNPPIQDDGYLDFLKRVGDIE